MRPLWVATEAEALGHGGITLVAQATRLSQARVARGIQELRSETRLDPARTRRLGGGRKRLVDTDGTLKADLNALIESITAGTPDQSPLRWTSKSVRKLTAELQALGHSVSHRIVCALLHELGYTLQANRKTREGTQHPDRDAQFSYLNDQVRYHQAQGSPTILVDTKKKELMGDCKNPGRYGVLRGSPSGSRSTLLWSPPRARRFPTGYTISRATKAGSASGLTMTRPTLPSMPSGRGGGTWAGRPTEGPLARQFPP